MFRKVHADYERIDWPGWKPVDHATLMFLFEGERVLLIRKKRGLGAGKINGPGGKLEAGESALDCVLRELKEEVGVSPRSSVCCRGELAFQFSDGYALFVHVFSGQGCNGTPSETEEALPMWVPLAQIPYDQMWADDQIWLPALLAGQGFRGRFLFDGDQLLGGKVVSWAPGNLPTQVGL